MGLLDRVVRLVNRAGDPVQDASTMVDPRLRRMGAVVEAGDRLTGRIVGIQRRHVDDATRTVFLVEVPGEPATEPRRFASEVTTTRHLHRLRLGLEVPVRVDGDRGAIDWPALAARWGLVGSEPGQRTHRKHPPEGIDDRDHTNATLKLLERGRRSTAVIAALDRVRVLGMPTVNWDVELTLEDGSTARRRKEEIPPYAWWYVGPGVRVVVAVDETDPSAVAIDWGPLARAAATGVDVDDVPPAGSIAAEAEADSAAEAASTTTATDAVTDTREVIARSRDVAQVNATLQSWVDEVLGGRMKPKKFLAAVAEWEDARLCTPEEAATARAGAGLDRAD